MTNAIVIGGGVMGLAAARELRRRGHTVTLLERAQPGRAASWASAGIIGATLRDESDPSYHLRRESRELWPAFAEAVRSESGMDPEYREMGCVQLASDAGELAGLQLAARRQADGPRRPHAERSSGLQADGSSRAHADGSSRAQADEEASGEDNFELLDAKQLRELEPALSSGLAGGLLVPGGNVDNRRLCKALEIAVRRAGVQIETGVEVTAIASAGGHVTGVEISPTTGFRPASADGLPLIGKGALDGLYFLTGHGPSGIAPLPGSIALLMALIFGEQPPLPAEAFDPLRFERAAVEVRR